MPYPKLETVICNVLELQRAIFAKVKVLTSDSILKCTRMSNMNIIVGKQALDISGGANVMLKLQTPFNTWHTKRGVRPIIYMA